MSAGRDRAGWYGDRPNVEGIPSPDALDFALLRFGGRLEDACEEFGRDVDVLSSSDMRFSAQ